MSELCLLAVAPLMECRFLAFQYFFYGCSFLSLLLLFFYHFIPLISNKLASDQLNSYQPQKPTGLPSSGQLVVHLIQNQPTKAPTDRPTDQPTNRPKPEGAAFSQNQAGLFLRT